MKDFNPFWKLGASRIIEAAEKGIGPLSTEQRIDLLLNNIPLKDSLEARQLLDSL